jgi:hypothetical protein
VSALDRIPLLSWPRERPCRQDFGRPEDGFPHPYRAGRDAIFVRIKRFPVRRHRTADSFSAHARVYCRSTAPRLIDHTTRNTPGGCLTKRLVQFRLGHIG